MYEYSAVVLRVVDGDTVHAELDLGMDVRIRSVLRLAGINAPELSTPAGPPARAHLQSLLAGGSVGPLPLVVRTVKDRQEKYGRYLAWLMVTRPDGTVQNVNDQMVKDGYAVVYNP